MVTLGSRLMPDEPAECPSYRRSSDWMVLVRSHRTLPNCPEMPQDMPLLADAVKDRFGAWPCGTIVKRGLKPHNMINVGSYIMEHMVDP